MSVITSITKDVIILISVIHIHSALFFSLPLYILIVVAPLETISDCQLKITTRAQNDVPSSSGNTSADMSSHIMRVLPFVACDGLSTTHLQTLLLSRMCFLDDGIPPYHLTGE